MSSTVLTSLENDVLTITFNRPEAMNSVDLEMARDMKALARDLPEEQSARVIVLKGAGSAFMAGGDVRAFETHLDRIGPFIREVIDGLHAFIDALRAAPQTVLACIHGAAAGGGLSLALASDLTIASRSAKLAFAYRHLGTSPDGGSTYFLPRIVGARRAMELLLTRDAISADEAMELGLVNWVVAPDELEAETQRVVERLSRNAPEANAGTKALLRGSLGSTLLDQLTSERTAFSHCASGQNFAEGVRAFLEKRPPTFTAVAG